MTDLRALVLLLASLAGCYYTRTIGPGGDHTDAAPDASGDASAGTAGPMTLRFTYRFIGGFAPASNCSDVFFQAHGDQGLQDYVTISDPTGGVIYSVPDCAPTACKCPSESTSDVCAGAAPPTVATLSPGASADVAWDGITWPYSCTQNGHSCQAPALPLSGPYLATFCWTVTSDGVGPDHHVTGTRTCSDVPFAYPTPGGIVEGFVDCVGI